MTIAGECASPAIILTDLCLLSKEANAFFFEFAFPIERDVPII